MTRIWRWLTCGHGHHHWSLATGVDLGLADYGHSIVVARACLRCGVVVILE